MIDLHAHILPGMNDGAKSWEDALEMAQAASAAGTGILPLRAVSGMEIFACGVLAMLPVLLLFAYFRDELISGISASELK